MKSLVFGVRENDPLTFAAMAGEPDSGVADTQDRSGGDRSE
jgi:hypothetical protein